MAKIVAHGGTEKMLILAVRQAYFQPFTATNWTDLRLGFFLSVTSAAVDDPASPITGLAESISTPQWTDKVSIGLTDRATGSIFLGYSNTGLGFPSELNSQLVSSDSGIGTSNTNFWRPQTEIRAGLFETNCLYILDGGFTRARGGAGSELHLPQDTAGAGGYSTLIGMRFQRPTSGSRTITMTVKTTGSGGHNGDILYSNTPTAELLESNLNGFPATVQQLGPVQLSRTPDTIWAFWPFHSSRLRIHAYAILRSGSG